MRKIIIVILATLFLATLAYAADRCWTEFRDGRTITCCETCDGRGWCVVTCY